MRIAIEGGEGTGKSTLISKLKSWFPEAVFAREGGLVGHNKSEVYSLPLREQAVIYAQERAELNHEVYIPYTELGSDIITDRSVVSNIVYQGNGTDEEMNRIVGLNILYDNGIVGLNILYDNDFNLPDHVVILDSDPVFNRNRMLDNNRELDERDKADLHYHCAIRDKYLRFAETNICPTTIIHNIHSLSDEEVKSIFENIMLEDSKRPGIS